MRHLGRVILALLLSSSAAKNFAAKPDSAPLRIETVRHEDCIVTEAQINGQTARFVLDTGSGAPFAVFASVAARLQLRLGAPPKGSPPEGRVAIRLTSPCDVQWLGHLFKGTTLGVIPPPNFVPDVGFDGLIGWPAFGENLLLFQIANAEAPVVPLLEFPAIPGAIQLTVAEGNTLALNFATKPSDGLTLLIDTGHAGGVVLSPARWRAWRKAHPQAPVTVQTGYMPAEGYVVEEIAWADKIQVGSLVLHQVPVMQAGATYLQQGRDGQEIVALGLFALKGFSLVVDGRTKRALISAEDSGPITGFQHNRIGATFLPAAGF